MRRKYLVPVFTRMENMVCTTVKYHNLRANPVNERRGDQPCNLEKRAYAYISFNFLLLFVGGLFLVCQRLFAMSTGTQKWLSILLRLVNFFPGCLLASITTICNTCYTNIPLISNKYTSKYCIGLIYGRH